MTTDDYLEKLAPYAIVRIHQSDCSEKWSADAHLRIRVKGGSFEASSEFGHQSARDAVAELWYRIRAAVVQAEELKRIGNE
jgi:hypothetical protein